MEPLHNITKICYTLDQLPEVTEKIANLARSKTICLYGPMGAGKTTLIKAIVEALGADGNANSPTFGIVNEYLFSNGTVLGYHFDFYRLKDETEALDLGLEDYLAQAVWIFMEWPERIPSFLPASRTEVHIVVTGETQREISLVHFP